MNHVNLSLAQDKIAEKLGYFPAFLIPATESAAIFRSLVQQTFSAYINNPLPKVFKEKLFVYLSRHCGISYLTICHSCVLNSLGVSAAEILTLGEIDYPLTESDVEADIQRLHNQKQTENWQPEFQTEASFLRCCSLIFFQLDQTGACAETLKKLLGIVNYNYLMIFLGYIKLSHQWIRDNPHIAHEQDRRSQLHLGSLLLSQIKLADFFQAADAQGLFSLQQETLHKLQSELLAENTDLDYKSAAFSALTVCLANVPLPIIIHDRSGKILYCNHSWLEISGFDSSEISTISQWNLVNNQINIGDRGRAILGLNNFDGSYSSFLQSIDPDEKESVDLLMIKTIQAHQNLNLEYRVVKSNQNAAVKTKGNLNYDAQGKAIKLKGFMTDITEYKRTSRRKSRQFTNQDQSPNTSQYVEKLETYLSLIPYYLFVVNVSTKTISFTNKALAKSLGLVDHQVAKGKAICECFSPEYTRQIIWQQQQVLIYGKVLHLQEEVKLADGVHYFDTTVTPIKNDEGKIYALLHTFNDVQNMAATQKALSQRSLQLEAANRELESFSYSVSHDLQSPLRIINGFSQVLWSACESKLDDRARHYLERIQANSQKMSDLIDALLELSRVTRSEMKSIEVNLSQIAQNIIEELQTQDPDRQVEIKIAPDLKAIGDPQLLRIVLDNLLHNAWKYTSKRSLAKIEFDALTANGEQSVFYVRDNGAGFDQDYADKLFTAFQRLHSQAEFPGTGIGLATVQRIIYRHGGKVWAKGECDRGTTIYFCL